MPGAKPPAGSIGAPARVTQGSRPTASGADRALHAAAEPYRSPAQVRSARDRERSGGYGLDRLTVADPPDEAALLIVVDVDQLPSMGPGRVLADIIASRRKLTLLSLTALTSAVPLFTNPCVASFRVQHTRSPLRSSMVSTP